MKVYASYNPDTFEFEAVVKVDSDASFVACGTDVLPSRAMLKALESKSIKSLVFDPESQKWKTVGFTEEEIQPALIQAKATVNLAIRAKLNEPFAYKNVIFGMSNPKQFEYYDFLISCVLGITAFPAKLSGSSNSSIEFNSLDDVKKFFAFFTEHKKAIKEVGRIIKYGGEINGVQFTALKEKSMNELNLEAIETLIAEAFSLWKESQQNAEA